MNRRKLKDLYSDSMVTLEYMPAPQVPYTFYVKDTEVMESLEQTVSELGAYHWASMSSPAYVVKPFDTNSY